MTLNRLAPNVPHRIVSIERGAARAQRLLAMGFLPGESVTVVQVAPFGDPITVELSGGWQVSLRRTEAALVRIAPAAVSVEG